MKFLHYQRPSLAAKIGRLQSHSLFLIKESSLSSDNTELVKDGCSCCPAPFFRHQAWIYLCWFVLRDSATESKPLRAEWIWRNVVNSLVIFHRQSMSPFAHLVSICSFQTPPVQISHTLHGTNTKYNREKTSILSDLCKNHFNAGS